MVILGNANAQKWIFNETIERHMARCRELAQNMGVTLGLVTSQLETLADAATWHDIGKSAIPANILSKPGPLTDVEWDVIRLHPEVGYRIAIISGWSRDTAEAIMSHHERWDGNGYPRGLRGEEIPLLARIIAVIDAYDAMTNTRPYRQAISSTMALAELERCAGSQFDPKLVSAFLSLRFGDYEQAVVR